MPTRLTIRFDFDADRRLGPGKVALLEAIQRTGSISAAGRAHEMSYRRAWLLVEDLNKLFGEALVTARPGGAKGGGAALTPTGEKVVALYRTRSRAAPERGRRRSAAWFRRGRRGAPSRPPCRGRSPRATSSGGPPPS